MATFTYRTNSQKIPNGIKSILTPEILTDICVRITGQSTYNVNEISQSYNMGRLVLLEHNGIKNYITLSESKIEGRNSSLQSVPTALNLFYSDSNPNKKLFYYFIPHTGNPFTDYHMLIYKLMITAGIEFLNISDYYSLPLYSYLNVDEIISERSNNKRSNRSNNSSFVTKTSDKVQLYAKTYGANKYEATILGLALSKIADKPVEIFVVPEGGLRDLPESSRKTLNELSNVSLYNTSLSLNRLTSETEETLRLRSAVYICNLLERIGKKKCAVCGCEIPEIIHGAHIWGVSEIKNCSHLDDSQKYEHATNSHNGLWLCHNHHKLFDSHFLAFNTDGNCLIKKSIPETHEFFIQNSITNSKIKKDILSDDFRYYLTQRNQILDMGQYIAI